jgi:quaternary ammonium compound-resistance protein SugE
MKALFAVLAHPWLMLIAAGVLEVVWALGLPRTVGFTRLWPSVWVRAAMAASFVLLASAVRTIPVSIAYPIWVGIGATGAYVGGVLILGDKWQPIHLLFIAMIVGGVVGLKAVGHTP